MEIPENRRKPVDRPIKGITGDLAFPSSKITLKVKFGLGHCSVEWEVEFLVVKFRREYNAIIGRVTQNALKAIVSTYDQAMKWLTDKGVGILRGNQMIASQCYIIDTHGLNYATA